MSADKKCARIYACGGAGINIAATFEAADAKNDIVQADVYLSYMDTSTSDMRNSNIDKEKVFIFTNKDGSEMDGSGQYRRTAVQPILAHTRELLQKFQPESLNIVIHSASGGSGSVIGPLLTKELIKRGERVIVFMIADDKNLNFAKNTLATIKTYANFVTEVETPIVSYLHVNQPRNSNATENKAIHQALNDVLTLFSGQNASLDSMDLSNWLDYQKVTGQDAHLSTLFINEETEEAAARMSDRELGTPLTVATLSTNDHPNPYFAEVKYQCEGKAPNLFNVHGEVLHFAIHAGYFPYVIDRLEKTINAKSEAIESSVIAKVDAKDGDDNGLVF